MLSSLWVTYLITSRSNCLWLQRSNIIASCSCARPFAYDPWVPRHMKLLVAFWRNERFFGCCAICWLGNEPEFKRTLWGQSRELLGGWGNDADDDDDDDDDDADADADDDGLVGVIVWKLPLVYLSMHSSGPRFERIQVLFAEEEP